ncbi:MAG: hypothetical protein K6F89_06940 [Prevotella sp.]|nr:hypothetical protein [Prevotella sp.]
MLKEKTFRNNTDKMYGDDYRNANTSPLNPAHVLPGNTAGVTVTESLTPSATNGDSDAAEELANGVKPRERELSLDVFSYPALDFINAMLPNGAPEGSRHKFALKIASDLILLFDGDMERVRKLLLSLAWVQDIVNERGMAEIDRIISAAKKRMEKREAENLYDPQPSKEMRRAIREVTKRDYGVLVREERSKAMGQALAEHDAVISMLERIGLRLEHLMKHFILLRLLCHGLKRRHYVAALFVGGGFAMTLMTRTWYRFWPEPSRKCRLNSIVELIGRSGSGKHIAVDLYRLMMEPVKKADAVQIEALNRWNEERDQKSGGEKNKTPRPQGVLRCLPSEASAAAIREAEFNAKETIDGEEWPLHVSQFNSELDDLLAQQKKSYMNIEALFLKSLHNEPAGSFLKTSSSKVGEYDVHFCGVYTGTEDALSLQNTTRNFARGLLQRLACVPMGDTNFEMRENRVYSEADRQRDQQLKEWSYRLDSTKGEIPCKELSDALYAWTYRRMTDAKEESSKALEDLVKRPCWISMNLALPFILARHWDQMVDDGGRMVCGPDFKTDKTDRELVLAICDAQFAFQQHFFLATGEKLYDDREAMQASNVRHQSKTLRAYRRLPEVFTSADVMREYGYDSVGSVCSRLKHLCDDGLAQKIRRGEDKGKYRKLTT